MAYYFEQKGSKRGDKYFFPKEFCRKLPVKPIKTKAEQKLHDDIVSLVDEMIEERKKLLELTRYITEAQFINQTAIFASEKRITIQTIFNKGCGLITLTNKVVKRSACQPNVLRMLVLVTESFSVSKHKSSRF